jgi:hypothetical protein
VRVYLDLDTQKLVSARWNGREIRTLRFKRSLASALEVQPIRDGIGVELPDDASGVFGVKAKGEYDANYLTAALSWVKSGSLYTFTISFINTALDALFNVDGDSANDVASLRFIGEIQWTVDPNTFKTPTLAVVIENDINRGGEILPAASPVIAFGVYLSGITALSGGSIGENPVTHLDAVPTIALLSGYVAEIILTVGDSRQRQTYELQAGAPDPDDDGQIEPLDYDLDLNNRHWARVA